MKTKEVLYIKAQKEDKIENFAKEVAKLRRTTKVDIIAEIKNIFIYVEKDMPKKEIIRAYLDKKYGNT
jgi:hypothetical protein